MRISVAWVVLTACSSPSPSPPHDPAHDLAQERAQAPGDAGLPATACPTAYGSTDTCTPAEPRPTERLQRTNVGQGPGPVERVATFESARCTYAQGTCECLTGPPRCSGGAAVRRLPPGTPLPVPHWECSPLVRADGCPGVEPRVGDPCKVTHSCGYCITLYSCEGGTWAPPVVGPPAP